MGLGLVLLALAVLYALAWSGSRIDWRIRWSRWNVRLEAGRRPWAQLGLRVRWCEYDFGNKTGLWAEMDLPSIKLSGLLWRIGRLSGNRSGPGRLRLWCRYARLRLRSRRLAPLAPDNGDWAVVHDVALCLFTRYAVINGIPWPVTGAFQKTEFFVASGRKRYRVWQWQLPGRPWRAERVADDLEGTTGLPRTLPLPAHAHTEAELAWVRGANA